MEPKRRSHEKAQKPSMIHPQSCDLLAPRRGSKTQLWWQWRFNEEIAIAPRCLPFYCALSRTWWIDATGRMEESLAAGIPPLHCRRPISLTAWHSP
jgi:hypothetical protein